MDDQKEEGKTRVGKHRAKVIGGGVSEVFLNPNSEL
jgi:hypothetical protein